MKFSQLLVGQRFEFEGLLYTKVGPVTAREERSGRQRMIPRSGEVSLLGVAPLTPPTAPATILDTDRVRAAINRYHAAAEQALAAGDPQLARAMLAAARGELFTALGLD